MKRSKIYEITGVLVANKNYILAKLFINSIKVVAKEAEIRELYLYIANDSKLYKKYSSILSKSMKEKNITDVDALRQLVNITKMGATKYTKQFSFEGNKWQNIFSKNDILNVAQRLLIHYKED